MSADSSKQSELELTSSNRLRGVSKVLLASLGIFLLSQFAAAFIVSTFLVATGAKPEEIEKIFTDSSALQFLVILLVEVATFIGVSVALRIVKKTVNIFQWKALRLLQVFKVFGYFIAYFTAVYLVTLLIASFVPSIDVNQAQQIGFESATGSSLLLVFLALCIAVPIGEEVLFRGLLYKGAKKFIGLWPAVALTTVLFGAAHLEFLGGTPLNWIAAIDTGLFSIALIYAYEKEKTIWAPILLHAIKNTLAFIFLFVVDK